jgi:hypothetical protein
VEMRSSDPRGDRFQAPQSDAIAQTLSGLAGELNHARLTRWLALALGKPRRSEPCY